MNSRELVLRALRGEAVPRPACGPLATLFCATDAGVSIRDFTLDPRAHLQCLLRYYDRYRPDAVWVSADTWVTAQAMGAPVDFPGGDQPMCGPPRGFIHSVRDLERIPPPDPYARGRQPLMLEAVARLVETLGSEVFVVGCFDQAPFSLACQALGLGSMMIRMVTDRPFVDALLDRCGEHAFAYAEAMARCGAHLLSTGDSPAVLIGPELYASVALPAERRLFSRLRGVTDRLLSLHICGNTTALLGDMARSGADVLELDHAVSMAWAARAEGTRIGLWGNLDPVAQLLQGTSAGVRQEARRVISEMEEAGCSRYVLASGCILAPGTPPENVLALIESARGA